MVSDLMLSDGASASRWGGVLQVDQTAPAYQTLLRHFRERCAGTNVDSHQRLRPGGNHQEATSIARVPACAATDIVVDALQEIVAETSCFGRRADRKQPHISYSTESSGALTGHYRRHHIYSTNHKMRTHLEKNSW